MSKALATTSSDDPGKWDDKFDLIIKWYNDERADDDPKKIKLHADLQAQLQRWSWLYEMVCIPKNRYKSDVQLIQLVQKQYPDLSQRTARRTLRDMRRFFGQIDQPQLAFEKVMLVASIKDTIKKAKVAKDFRAAASAENNLTKVLGADQAQQAVENTTIINIIGFNPEQLGAQPLPEDQLNQLIAQVLAADQKAAEQPFTDFTEIKDGQ